MTTHSTQSLRSYDWGRLLKNLALYILFPILCLALLARPIGEAVRASDAAAYLILLAALVAVGINWLIYTVLRRKRPSLLVYAHGVGCLLLTVIVEHESLLNGCPLESALAMIGGCLMLVCLFLLSFFLAAHRSRPAHAAAVTLWVIIAVIAFFMLNEVIQDFKTGHATLDTWLTLLILLSLLPAACIRRIRSRARLKAAREKASAQTPGRILQLIGETALDRDDDLVTNYHARVQYTVDGVSYETRAVIAGITMRRFGRQAFIGQEIPVHYDPENPAHAYADRIDRHFFDAPQEDSSNSD